jgi:hypothetical protein
MIVVAVTVKIPWLASQNGEKPNTKSSKNIKYTSTGATDNFLTAVSQFV